MHPDRPVLSSMSATLDDLVARVSDVAERLMAAGEEGDAADLFEVERALSAAARRLHTTLQRLG